MDHSLCNLSMYALEHPKTCIFVNVRKTKFGIPFYIRYAHSRDNNTHWLIDLLADER